MMIAMMSNVQGCWWNNKSTLFNAYLKSDGFDQYQELEHTARQAMDK